MTWALRALTAEAGAEAGAGTGGAEGATHHLHAAAHHAAHAQLSAHEPLSAQLLQSAPLDHTPDLSGTGTGTHHMSMQMTFGSWSDFKLKLLFSEWNIQERWQFALAWFAVCLTVVLYHSIRYYIGLTEQELAALRLAARTKHREVESGKRDGAHSARRVRLRLLHALLSALNYGLALLLMLVAMTYNPLLLTALVVGYFIGDFLFLHETDARADGDSAATCH